MLILFFFLLISSVYGCIPESCTAPLSPCPSKSGCLNGDCCPSQKYCRYEFYQTPDAKVPCCYGDTGNICDGDPGANLQACCDPFNTEGCYVHPFSGEPWCCPFNTYYCPTDFSNYHIQAIKQALGKGNETILSGDCCDSPSDCRIAVGVPGFPADKAVIGCFYNGGGVQIFMNPIQHCNPGSTCQVILPENTYHTINAELHLEETLRIAYGLEGGCSGHNFTLETFTKAFVTSSGMNETLLTVVYVIDGVIFNEVNYTFEGENSPLRNKDNLWNPCYTRSSTDYIELSFTTNSLVSTNATLHLSVVLLLAELVEYNNITAPTTSTTSQPFVSGASNLKPFWL